MNQAIEILVVEDNPGDIRLMQEVFKEGKLSHALHVVRDGVEALAYLRRQSPFERAGRPDLVLLDLNLPRKDGRELLTEIKADQDLKRIPVVILTTSKAEQDILKAYNSHANCYITKPVDLEEFIRITKVVEDFWLQIVRLPRGD